MHIGDESKNSPSSEITICAIRHKGSMGSQCGITKLQSTKSQIAKNTSQKLQKTQITNCKKRQYYILLEQIIDFLINS